MTEEGVLYKLDDDGTASLAYVPNGLTSYAVPSSITTTTDAGVAGATYSVDRVESNAVHMADSLASITFEEPSKVTIAPSAFTGRSTGSDDKGLLVNGQDHIDPTDFKVVSVLCDYPLDSDETMRLVPAIESHITNTDGKQTAKTTIAVNDKNVDDDDVYRYKTGEKATYTIAISNEDNVTMQDVVRVYFAWDSASPNLGSFPPGSTYNLVNPGSGTTYPCKVVETETPGILYYEISGILPGETLAFQNDVFYPSPGTPGGTLRIWTETLTEDEAKELEGKLIDPTDYLQLEWDTTPVVYDLEKSRSYYYGIPSGSTSYTDQSPLIKVNNKGEATVSNVAFMVEEKNEGSSALTEGLDLIRWVQYEDVLDLPEELYLRPEVVRGIQMGPSDGTSDGWFIADGYQYTTRSISTGSVYSRMLRVRVDGVVYDVAYIYSPNTNYSSILDFKPQIVTVGGEQRLKLTWYVNNPTLDSTGSATNEYATRRFYLRIGDNVIMADVDKVEDLFDANPGYTESPLHVNNDATETRHYSYSDDQVSTDDAYVPVTANAGMNVSKFWQNAQNYGGNYDAATVRIANTGIMRLDQWGTRVAATDENGNVIRDANNNVVYEKDEFGRDITNGDVMTDNLPTTHFITPENIEAMLNATATAGEGDNAREWPVGDWLTITIAYPTLCTPDQYQPVDGTDQTNKYTEDDRSNLNASNDKGARVYQGANAFITITKNDEGQIVATLVGDTIAENNRSYVIGEGGDYATVDAFFTAIGYFPTRNTQYRLAYNTDDFTLQAGQVIDFDIRCTLKTTPMMLTADQKNTRGTYLDYHNNGATVAARVGDSYTSQYRTTSSKYWHAELYLYKYGYVEGNNTQLSGAQIDIDEGTVLDFYLSGRSQNTEWVYDHQIMSDYMNGAMVVLVPVAQNPNLKAPDGSALDTYESNGVSYWLLNKEGSYDDVVLGATSRNGTPTYVTKTLVVSKSTSSGTPSLATQIQWEPYEHWGSGNKSTTTYATIYYKVLVSAVEAGLVPEGGVTEGTSYAINNKAWLGDHQGHRLWDWLIGEYQIYKIDKAILNTAEGALADGTASYDDGTLLDYSRVHMGETVTYQMRIDNITSTPATLTGDRIRDALPDTYGVFSWTRGDADAGVEANVTNLRYVADGDVTVTYGTGDDAVGLATDGSTNEGDTYWTVAPSTRTRQHYEGSSLQTLQRKNGYDITWDKDFTIKFSGHSTLYIYVDLTFPERPDEGASEWDQYVAAVKGGEIYNDFYLDYLWDQVAHTLEAEGRPVLYKGVFDGGMMTHSQVYPTNLNYGAYASNKSRLMYVNGTNNPYYEDPDLKASTVTYYTVLYNGSYDRMYLSDLQDQLPRGFTFNSFCNTSNNHMSTSGGNPYGYMTGSSGNYTYKSTGTTYSYNYVGYSPNDRIWGTNNGTYTVYQTLTEGYNNTGNQYSSSSRLVDIDNSADSYDQNDVTYVNARITATTSMGADGRQHVTYSISSANANGSYYKGIHYDPVVKKYYLNPGEALRFGYNCVVSEYASTDDLATNTIAMPYYDYYATGFELDVPDENGEGGAVQHARAVSGTKVDNDGTCTLMSDVEVESNFGMDASAYQDDPYKSNEDGNWLVSSVSLERAPVTPGVQKTVGGTTAKAMNPGATTIEGSRGNDAALYGSAYSGGAKTSDVINWRLRVFNESGGSDDDIAGTLQNYELTDTVVTPFSFTGQVFYNMYRASSSAGARTTTASQYLFTLGSRTEGDTTVRISSGSGVNGTPSGYTASWKTLSIGSAEDDSDDDWFTFGTGAKIGRVKIERDAEGQEVMTIQLEGSGYAIPGGYWMDVCVHTMFVADQVIISEGKYNDVVLRTEQDYDPADVAQGRARTTQRYDTQGNLVTENDGIQSGASIMLTQGYTTNSWKVITENGNETNTARSDGSPTYITLSEKCETFRYDLYMVGPSAVMSKVVFIDDLPQEGDHSAFVEADKRNSDFTVSFLEDNPDFHVTLASSEGAAERELVPNVDYTIEVSSKTEFDRATDWMGEGDGWTDITGLSGDELAEALSGARSLRVVIVDPEAFQKKSSRDYMMMAKCQIHISFNARVDDPSALPGEYAWNSFGYKYQVPLTFNGSEGNSTVLALEAQPLNVGVRFPAAPSLSKRLTEVVQKMEPVTEEVEVTEEVPVLGEDGAPVLDDEGNPVTQEVTRTETRVVTQQVERPVYDPETGEPLVDEDGNPVTQLVDEPVMQPATQPVLDADGNPVLDDDGNPVTEPVMEVADHAAIEDVTFEFLVYEGSAIPELDDALEMSRADIAAALSAAGRKYVYVPLTLEEGSSSVTLGLWNTDYEGFYDEDADAFGSATEGEYTWHWVSGNTYTVLELPMGEYNYVLRSFRVGQAAHEQNNVSFQSANGSVVALLGTNQYEPEYVDVSGTKVWDDADDQDGKRPESITVRLLADGVEVDSATVTADDDWSWSFEHLLKEHENGDKIQYQVTEDAVSDYSASYDVSADGYESTITNTHTPGATSVTVTKTWDDGNDADGIRPKTVVVRLLANGEDTGLFVTLSESTGWIGYFIELDEYADGKKIDYTVAEDPVEGYDAPVITGDATTGYVIENPHTPTPPEPEPPEPTPPVPVVPGETPGTGDAFLAWVPVVLAIAGAAALLASRRLRRG